MRRPGYIGIILLVTVIVLFVYRGEIIGYVVERWEKRGVPRPVSVEQILAEQTAVDSAESTREVEREGVPSGSNEAHNSSPPPLTSDATVRSPTETSDLRGGEIAALPAEFNLAVPFTAQAPFAVWDALHEDACEEASVMMVNAFYQGRTFTRDSADQEIYRISDWETKTFGYWKDTDASETARILQEYYGYKNVRLVENPTIEDIKREVFEGRPVILPAAGQLLDNRYFKQPGPLYHMLVVRGWTAYGKIITNDPGTKRGEEYLYDPDVLMNAVHDFNGGDVLNGRKVMIVVEK